MKHLNIKDMLDDRLQSLIDLLRVRLERPVPQSIKNRDEILLNKLNDELNSRIDAYVSNNVYQSL